ncbi:M48 family peptidase, partial [Campylobacter novaezeelandiae]|nr:M48 family peptidase [Campylobacter novaezeelandiae]
MILIAILCFYTAIFSLISYMQIQFLEKQKLKKAFILDDEAYKNAANIAIENEKFKIFSNFYTLIIN